MRRLALTCTAALFAFLLLVPPAWAGWVWPLHGEVITPYRNGDDPYAAGQHRGIDIAGDVGAPVVAAVGGEVRFAGTAGSSGHTVSIRTDDGRYDTSYLHLSSSAVREGDRVAAGALVGAVGTSGDRSASVPHLHFGVRDAGSRHSYHDPLGLLPPPATSPPRGAPAPQPAPVPVAPAPEPGRVPVGRLDPVRAPAPRRVPVPAPGPRRVPVPGPGPRRVPVPSPGRVPVPSPRRVPVGAPQRVPVGAPRPAGLPVRAPSPAGHGAPTAHGLPLGARRPGDGPADAAGDGRARGRSPAGSPSPVGARAGGSSPAASSALAPKQKAAGPSGPDLGLVLACLGLLAAAALLGFTEDGQKAAQRTRRRIAGMLRPMLGRR